MGRQLVDQAGAEGGSLGVNEQNKEKSVRIGFQGPGGLSRAKQPRKHRAEEEAAGEEG